MALVFACPVVLWANTASADSIQYQSYQRANQSETCTSQPGETAWQASWGSDSSWHPSWEQWANSGQGGWTCTRAITWARSSDASASEMYAVGDIGPGGGLVFLINNGVRYEMAPKTWGAGENGLTWCDGPLVYLIAAQTAIGTGAANTAAMAADGSCGSDAAAAVLSYSPAGTNAGEWYLPSQDELNAMCNYSRSPVSPPTGACAGLQDSTFASGSSFGFSNSNRNYWSSSQANASAAWTRRFANGSLHESGQNADLSMRVRPIRAF